MRRVLAVGAIGLAMLATSACGAGARQDAPAALEQALMDSGLGFTGVSVDSDGDVLQGIDLGTLIYQDGADMSSEDLAAVLAITADHAEGYDSISLRVIDGDDVSDPLVNLQEPGDALGVAVSDDGTRVGLGTDALIEQFGGTS